MKNHYDYEKLIDELHKKGIKCAQVAALLNMDERSFLRKIASIEEFTQYEIELLVDRVLQISPEHIPEYFFTKLES